MFSTLKSKIENLPEKKLRVFAYVLLATAGIDLLTGVVLFSIGFAVAAYCLIGLAAGFGLVILPLLLSGYALLARILTPYFATILIFFFASYYGPAVDPWTSMFIGATYPFLVFSEHERRYQVITLLAPLMFYIGLVFTEYSVLKDAGVAVAWFEPPKYFSFALNLGTFFIIATCYFLFSRQTQKYETLLRSAVNDLKYLRKTDGELNAQMSSLISIICHDIANPLNVAIYNVRRMLKADPNEKSLLKISRANDAILNIIQSVHRLQELRTGRIKIEDCETKLDRVVVDCLDVVQDSLADKNITLETEIDPWFKQNPVLADQKVLTYSVVLNLLTNAIKYSPVGSIIRVKAKKVAQSAELTVSDSGPGISAALAPHIFNLSENKSTLGSAGETGSGFGLPIAKTCMALMLGDISFVSKTVEQDPVGHGTVFSLHLRCR